MACMKHVGLNVAADPLYSVSYMGVNGGLVLVVADDPGLYSSQNEQDTRMVARAAQIPVIEPSDSAEAKEFFKTAFELSEQFDRPFIFRTTTRLAHSQGLVELCDRVEPEDKPYEKNIRKHFMQHSNYVTNISRFGRGFRCAVSSYQQRFSIVYGQYCHSYRAAFYTQI